MSINIFQRYYIHISKLDLPYILLEKFPSRLPHVCVITGVKHIKKHREITSLEDILSGYPVHTLAPRHVQLFLNHA